MSLAPPKQWHPVLTSATPSVLRLNVNNFVATVYPNIKAKYDSLDGAQFPLPNWEVERLRQAGVPESEWRYKNSFGMFAQMTVNSPTDASGPHVKLSPHVDWKNMAAGICVVLPYGESSASCV